MKVRRRSFVAGSAMALAGCTSSERLREAGFGVASNSRGGRSRTTLPVGGQAWAKREYREKFLASGATLRYAARGCQGRAWTSDLQRGYDSFKYDTRVGYAVKNLRTGRYLAEHNADEQKFGGSMPKPAVSATLLERRKGDLTREEFQHIVYVCDKSINASWKALLTRFNHADEQAFEQKYNLPDVGIRANTQSPRFYAEFFERCVNYKIDYGCELLIEAMRRSQYGRGRWYLPSSITFAGGKTGTSGAFKHEGLFFNYRGTPYAIVVYTKGHFGRGANIWKMGAMFGGLFREYVA